MRRARRLIAASVLVVAVGGCAWVPLRRVGPGAAALERADDLARAGAWEDAVHAYGEYLVQYPEAEEAGRAAASRDTLRALLGARAEGARLRGEATRLREEMARLREELVRRDGDLVRVRQEAERLKTDLERLKQIDLKLERRR
jgi:hypothetical protein